MQRFLADGSVLTRDIGYLDKEGFLHLADRKDDMIISGGYKLARPARAGDCPTSGSGTCQCGRCAARTMGRNTGGSGRSHKRYQGGCARDHRSHTRCSRIGEEGHRSPLRRRATTISSGKGPSPPIARTILHRPEWLADRWDLSRSGAQRRAVTSDAHLGARKLGAFGRTVSSIRRTLESRHRSICRLAPTHVRPSL